jgi:hypothetical protein
MIRGFGPFPVSAYGVPDKDSFHFTENKAHGGYTLVEQYNSHNHPVDILTARASNSAHLFDLLTGYNYKQRFDGV